MSFAGLLTCNRDVISMKIFVGNLSLVFTEDDLKHLFKTFGEVSSVTIVTDKISGLPSGFVDMPSDTEGELAIRTLDGIEVIGHTITLRSREKDSERRDADNRRLQERRGSMDRRMPLDRRLYIDKIEFDERRDIPDRRVNPPRRSNNSRRSTSSRRSQSNRRA